MTTAQCSWIKYRVAFNKRNPEQYFSLRSVLATFLTLVTLWSAVPLTQSFLSLPASKTHKSNMQPLLKFQLLLLSSSMIVFLFFCPQCTVSESNGNLCIDYSKYVHNSCRWWAHAFMTYYCSSDSCYWFPKLDGLRHIGHFHSLSACSVHNIGCWYTDNWPWHVSKVYIYSFLYSKSWSFSLAIQYKIKISHDLHWGRLNSGYGVNGLRIPLFYERPVCAVYMVNDRDIAWKRQV